jgi:predicted XRE-type DNA-binding protein
MSKNPGWVAFFISHSAFVIAVFYNVSLCHHADRFGNLFRAIIRGALKDDGFFEELQALAIKEVVVWHLTEAMEKQSLFKASLATLLKTGRSQVDRLLDPTRVVTLSILQRAAALVGRKVQIEDEVWK